MKKTPGSFKPEDDSDNSWVGYLGLGTQLAATVVVMVLLGVWLDGKFNTKPVLTVVCSFLGVAAGLYSFIKSALKSDDK
jgi:ATP synthase protein I